MEKWIRSIIASLKEREPSIFIGTFIALTAIRIYLITGIPKILVYGPHDDLFFAGAAHHIIHGDWMGPYSQMTLIKAPFYSFFLIFSFFTGLPLFLNETLFYIGACIVIFYAFAPLIESRWWRLLLFVFVAYCPVGLATYWTLRVYREFTYLSLTLYVVSFSIGLLLRLNHKISQLLLWSMGLGLSMGAFMITREEGTWIYPVLFSLLSFCLLFIFWGKLDKMLQRSCLVLLSILIWYIPIITVSSLNYSHYGFWGTTENLDPDYNRIFSTLGRIKTSDTWHPAIQIHHDSLLKAYEVSRLLNDIKDPIERITLSSNNTSMSSKPEWYLLQYGDGGNKIGTDRYRWLFRDIVYDQGYYASGKYPHDFYKQLADQLESACDNGLLDCSPARGIPVIGAIDRRHYPIIARMLYENTLHLLRLDYTATASLDIHQWDNWPKTLNSYKFFEEFIYNPMDVKGTSLEKEEQYIVYGRADVRLKMLQYKEKLMTFIANIYKKFTLPLFITGLGIWIYSMIFLTSRKQREHQMTYLIISLFTLGLFLSRLMLLTLLDATTSVSGMAYSGSIYIFIYIFSFVMLYWAFERVTMVLQKNNLFHKTPRAVLH